MLLYLFGCKLFLLINFEKNEAQIPNIAPIIKNIVSQTPEVKLGPSKKKKSTVKSLLFSIANNAPKKIRNKKTTIFNELIINRIKLSRGFFSV